LRSGRTREPQYRQLRRGLIAACAVVIFLTAGLWLIPVIVESHAVGAKRPLRCPRFPPSADSPATSAAEAQELFEAAERIAAGPEYTSGPFVPQPLTAMVRGSVLSIKLPRRGERFSTLYDGELYARAWDEVYSSHHSPFTLCTTVVLTYRSEPGRTWYVQAFFHNTNAPVITGSFAAPFDASL